jgi:hypothetical protein
LVVQLGSCVPKMYMHDCVAVGGKGCSCLTSATVAGKGHTRLPSAIVTSKAGVTCQQAAISATGNHRRLLTTP